MSLVTPRLRRLFTLARTASQTPGVQLEEDWRDNNTYITWKGRKPRALEELCEYFSENLTADGQPILVEDTDCISLIRPNIASYFYDDHPSGIMVFFKAGSLGKALIEGANLQNSDFTKQLLSVERVIAEGLTGSFKAGRIIFASPSEERSRLLFSKEEERFDEIPEEVLRRRITIHEGAVVPRPHLFWPIAAHNSSYVLNEINQIALMHLAACFATEILSGSRIVIKGARELRASIHCTTEPLSASAIETAAQLCKWAYSKSDEYASERKKFICLHFSDFIRSEDESENILPEISEKIFYIKKYSEESFGFFIKGKVDDFIDEQNKLAEAVKKLAADQSERARNLINSLFRDAFLSAVAISLTAARVSSLQNIGESGLINVIAILVAVSGSVHLFNTILDAILSRREFQIWSERLLKLLPRDSKENILDRPLRARNISFLFVALSSALGYLCLSVGIWNLEYVLEWASQKK